jgi:Na+-driven multidrug efflux pump
MMFTFGFGFRGAAAATVVAQYAAASLLAWSAFAGPRRATFFGGGGRFKRMNPEVVSRYTKEVVGSYIYMSSLPRCTSAACPRYRESHPTLEHLKDTLN